MTVHRVDHRWHGWPDPVGVDAHGIGTLDDPTCWRLLATAPVGRLGLSANALPTILPVNHVVRSESILFKSESGTKLLAATRGEVACFEVDEFDGFEHRGWSVTATGRLSLVGAGELETLDNLPLVPWALTGDLRVARLDVELLSGRAFGR